MVKKYLSVILAAALLAACGVKKEPSPLYSIPQNTFGIESPSPSKLKK